MFGSATLAIFGKVITEIHDDLSKEKSKIGIACKSIISHPIKVVASFIAAPFLVFKVACLVKNPIRKIIAILGLLLSAIASYGAATFLGSLVGAAFVATQIGWLAGLGFLFGTTLSIYLSVAFSTLSFNSVSFLFLKMSSQEVVDYLQEISA